MPISYPISSIYHNSCQNYPYIDDYMLRMLFHIIYNKNDIIKLLENYKHTFIQRSLDRCLPYSVPGPYPPFHPSLMSSFVIAHVDRSYRVHSRKAHSMITFPIPCRTNLTPMYAHEVLGQPSVPFRFPIVGLLAEGITLLGAKSPLHLQSLCLHLASSISAGQPALDDLPTCQSTVLYLTTSYTSTKHALEQMKTALPAHHPISFPNLVLLNVASIDPLALPDLLESFVQSYSNVHQIVIDSLFTVCHYRRALINHVGLVSRLKDLCNDNHLSLLLPHCVSHTKRDYIPDAFTGLSAYTTDPDIHTLLLHQHQDYGGLATFTLHLHSFLIEHDPYQLLFSRTTRHWSITEHATVIPPLSKERQEVITVLQQEGDLSPTEIAK